MGFLRSGNQPTQITKYSGLQIQSTSSAIPIPIVYGRSVVAPNVIWYQNFQGHYKKGGKGKQSSGTISYTCDIIMGVCEGPVNAINQVWQSSTTPTTLAELGLGFFGGVTPQPVWSYVTALFPTEALSYGGVCYVCGPSYNLGSGAAINISNMEVLGALAGSGYNGVDADPAQVVYDFLTNSQYGAGFPPGSISSASLYSNADNYQSYCKAAGLAFSPVLSSQETASSILDRWLQITNSAAIWSDGMLKIIPFGDAAISANGADFTPNTTPLYSLTDEDFLYSAGDDPVKIVRSDPYSAANWQSIEIQARSDSYATGPITAFDQSMIDRFGRRVGSTVTAHEICDVGIGQTAAQLILQRGLYIRNTFSFRLSGEFCLLEPMDLVEVSDASIGLNATVVRITEIEEDDSGDLTITAEEFPQGVATSAAYPTQSKSNGSPNTAVAPNPVNTPLIIEPPPALTGNARELWVGVSPQGGDPNWGGCIVFASFDGSSYAEVATINASAQMGALSAALPAYLGSNPDNADTLSVDMTESAGTLVSTTAASAYQGVTMCYVGGEYLSYVTATLTAPRRYNLSGLYRGQGGLGSLGAASGAAFCLLDSTILKYAIPSVGIGQTIYLKFQSFNIFGDGLQDISTCAAYSCTIAGTGSLGPVSAALALGTAMDFGHVANEYVAETDDYGTTASAVTTVIDLGQIIT